MQDKTDAIKHELSQANAHDRGLIGILNNVKATVEKHDGVSIAALVIAIKSDHRNYAAISYRVPATGPTEYGCADEYNTYLKVSRDDSKESVTLYLGTTGTVNSKSASARIDAHRRLLLSRIARRDALLEGPFRLSKIVTIYERAIQMLFSETDKPGLRTPIFHALGIEIPDCTDT